MRVAMVLGAALAAALAFGDVAASAQAPAWCAKIAAGKDHVTERCEYRTFEACRQAIIGQGPSFCVQNPASGERAAEKARPRRKPASPAR